MNHPKMSYTYVGIDSHKDTHTAVFLDCFFEKLGEIKFDNLPSKFPMFLTEAEKFRMKGTAFLFGLEDTSMYGRSLAVFLTDNGQQVKHVNAMLVARERKNQTITQKTDSIDAQCAARVLLSKFSELPDADPDDRHWILKTIVMRRAFIIKNNSSLKNHLHSILTQHYPHYRTLFPTMDSNVSLAFFMRYPSPSTLVGTTVEELADFFRAASLGKFGFGRTPAERAGMILDTIEDTTVPLQEIRDEAVRSTIRQIQFNLAEIKQLEATLAKVLAGFNTTLTSMNGMDTVSAAQMLSCIGDIKRFSTPAKLARYAGIAPVTYASGKKDKQFSNQRGNRELNSIFHMLAIRHIAVVRNSHEIKNPFFYEYFHRKVSEGKTKRQALKCVERRLVNIIWSMLTHGKEYINPPMIDNPEKNEKRIL